MPSSAATLTSLLVTVLWSAGPAFGFTYPESKGNGWDGVCRSGTLQSPIDIPRKGLTPASYEPIVLVNYDTKVTFNLTNNGHTVLLTANHPCTVHVTGGGLKKLYTLDHMHFHWGSEHMVNGIRYPLELHFVHYDSHYASLQDAVGNHGGVAVLAVLFKDSESDTPNGEIADIVAGVRTVAMHESGSTKLPARFSPGNLLPTDVTRWWRYWGSLTTPSCAEGVIWTVLEDTLPVEREQVKEFQQVLHGNEYLLKNFRATQPINQRVVFHQDPDRGVRSSTSHTASASGAGSIILTLIVSILSLPQ